MLKQATQTGVEKAMLRNTNSNRFFTNKNNIQEQSTAADSRFIDLGNKIFWEFNPYKTVPTHLPHTYQLHRLTQPPIYLRSIKESPELQKHLANKIIKLLVATQKMYQTYEVAQTIMFEHKREEIEGSVLNLLRQIDVDLSRPKGFQSVTGEQVRLIMVQAFEWNHAVVNWIEEIKQVDVTIKKAMPARLIDAQKLETLKKVQSVESHERWPSSVSDAAKKLMLAIAQHEAEHSSGGSPK